MSTPTGVPARANDASTGRGPRSANTISVTTPTACAMRLADSSSASSNRRWYSASGWYSMGSDSA